MRTCTNPVRSMILPLTLAASVALAGPTPEQAVDLPHLDSDGAATCDAAAYRVAPEHVPFTPRNRGMRRGDRAIPHLELIRAEREAWDAFRGRPHEYLQFVEIPNRSRKRELQDQGILLTGYVADNTYIAVLTRSGRALVESDPGLSSHGPIPIESKLEPELLDGGVHVESRDEIGRILLDVRFHGNVSLTDARKAVEDHGGVVIDDSGYDWHAFLPVAMKSRSIVAFAAADAVRFVSRKRTRAQSQNASAAELHQVDQLWQPPYDLNGAGLSVGIWDIGSPFANPEFASRLTHVQLTDMTAHATHVTGTIGASGTLGSPDSEDSHGMANEIGLFTYTHLGYAPEYFVAISNADHPVAYNGWNYEIGWFWFEGCTKSDGCLPEIPPSWQFLGNIGDFGRYTGDSVLIDSAADFAESTGKTFLIFFPAGNDRGDGPEDSHDGTEYYNPDEVRPYYDTIGGLGNSKNGITVGAIDHNLEMSYYSSWGPCNDGRIKPDLVAQGHAWSPTGLTEYAAGVGTSTATAVAAGSAALIIEQYTETFAASPTNAEIKAIMINTANDLGHPGPDYVYGFGALQTQAAVDLIRSDSPTIHTGSLGQGQVDTYSVAIEPETPSLKCTLTWIDEPGTEGAPALVNDMSLRLLSPTNQGFFPFKLNASDPTAPATSDSINNRDTVEQIVIQDPQAGDWTLEIRGISVPVGPQSYGVVCGGALFAPSIYDFLPPAVPFHFPYPYSRPVLSAKYVDLSGSGIDTESIEVNLNYPDVTDDVVASAEGVYYEAPFPLLEGENSFVVSIANIEGLRNTATLTFNIVNAGEVQDLTVETGPSGEAVLEWGDPAAKSSSLLQQGFRIYRSTNLQTELEWIGSTADHTFTDPSPPVADVVFYEVHGIFVSGSLNRILSTRTTPYRTRQPFVTFPRDDEAEPLPPGTFDIRIFGMAEPGATVHLYVDDVFDATTVSGPDGSFEFFHDFGGPGEHQVYVQAKVDGKGISVPSVEIQFDIPPLDGGPPPCNCCSGGDALGCNDDACEAAVCAADAYCCQTEWDDFCNEEAEIYCDCC